MGGGHVSRPDFGMPQPDAAYPLTEFYLLAQQALEKSGSFMLPALYAGLQAPARRIYREEAAGYLQLAAAPADQHPCAVPDRRGNKRNGDHMCGTADKDKDAAKNTAHKNRVLPFLNHFACPLFLTLHDFYRICKHY